MKKNKLFLLPFVACALLWSACSNELDISDNPNRAGAGEAILSVSLQFPEADKLVGYAPGDLGENVLPGVALDEEKEIRSIAFIAFTTGGTGIYLSTVPALSDNGFTDPLTAATDKPAGNYTASFKIKSSDFSGTTTLVAIANFAEHGLTFDPDVTIESLKSMLTEAVVKNGKIDYPLTMTVVKELEILDGSTTPVDFVMERIMARVDVVNNAYDKQTPANGFVLTSARLLSAAAQGTMMGSQTIAHLTYVDMASQTTVAEIAPADGNPVSPTNPATQQLAPMYAYENSNAKEDGITLSDNATSVEVKGTYKGKAYAKVIPFKTMEKIEAGEIVGGDIVPIARNFRYVVEITSGKEEELTFDLKVTDWTEGKELEVELEFAKPKVKGLEGFTAPNGATWDADTKTLNITNAEAVSEFNLVVSGYQDSDFKFDAEYDANDTSLAKAITVERGEISGYADAGAEEEAPLSRTYTITIPAYKGECPSLTKLIVYNAAYVDAKEEITVKYAPVFAGGIKSESGASIDQKGRLVDLKNITNGQTGTFSFFASCNTEFTTEIEKKGVTDGFYTITSTEDETDMETIGKFGPGKRVTVSYKALTDSPELAEVKVSEKDVSSSPIKKVYVKCFKKAYFESAVLSPNADNALADGNQLYLAVNNGEHGTIDYTVYDDKSNTIAWAPAVTYSGTATSEWTKGITLISDELVETVSDNFQIVKRTLKVSLPQAIKAPAQATIKAGGSNTGAAATLTLTPVYLSGDKIGETDKAFRPVLVKTVWWSPINVGQTKIPARYDAATLGGNIFQWGRKQPLAWNSGKAAGPVESAEAAGENFIMNDKGTSDWLQTKNDKLWNSGTESAPIKTENDPCPVGWRVPTETELKTISGIHNYGGGSNANSCGILTISGLSGNSLIIPATGFMGPQGTPGTQGGSGYLWTSTASGTGGRNFGFGSNQTNITTTTRAYAIPVRCIQE